MNDFISQACINLRPKAGISIDENGIHWHNIQDNEIPTQQEIDDEANRLKLEFESTQYQRDRKKSYPSFADQFDLLYHGGYDAWRTAIQTIKDKYPKGATP